MLVVVRALGVLVAVAVLACQAVPVANLHNSAPSSLPGFGVAKHVLVIGVDGFGGLYLENATSFLPTFKALIEGGASTTRARNQMPTVSAPNWATTITGMGPEETGVFDNDWVPADDDVDDVTAMALPPISGKGAIPQPMWAAAKAQAPHLKVAVSISWDWITFLSPDASVDQLYRGHEDDQSVGQQMAAFIREDSPPNLMFVHLDQVDEAGHGSYWGSPTYYNATKNVDTIIANMTDALQDAGILHQTLIVVTADHGGWRGGHGMNNQACFYIPIVFHGAGVKAGQLSAYVTNKDIAPTVLHALGLQKGEFMVGRVLDEVFGQ